MKKKIKVMHMIWSMGDGGAQQVVINYLRDFQNDPDIELKLYVYTNQTDSKYDKEIAEKGYNVVYLNNPRTKIQIPYIKRYFQRPVSQKTWDRAIHEYKPDVVHVHISALLDATMPRIIKNEIPVRFDTLHSSPYRYTGRIKKIISHAFQKEGVIPICVTEAQVEEAKEWYGITKYEVVRNGVDIEKIKEKCCSKIEARKEFGLSTDDFVVIGVGRLNPIKKYDLLIDAFAKVKKKKPESVLLLAGDGTEKKKLQHKAMKLGISESVRFLGNIADVTKLYCAADVLAVTSDTESSSLVAIEAQVCGTRCVLSAGVPRESILLDRTQRLEKDATAKDWCCALLNESYIGSPAANIEDYEVHNMSRKMKEIYLKYYSEYEENQNADTK
jgi:glycosyltransferase involved in cell wall biosynthesis